MIGAGVLDGLYVHVPFCARKCGYCDFYSEAAGKGDIDRYLDAVDAELGLRAREFGTIRPSTVFFGGGTPTMLPASGLRRLGEILWRHCDLGSVVEWTSEINPGTLTPEKAEALVAMGVNRASFGVQSFDPAMLKLLDRENEFGKADASIAMVKAAGIGNFSIDLIFGVPGQTEAQWSADLEQALQRESQHISLYALTYEDDTPITRQRDSGEFQPMDPEQEAALYALTVDRCRKAGFARYEVSNFARPGRDSLHNGHYWACRSWLGIGPGAHSGLDLTRGPWPDAVAGRLKGGGARDGVGEALGDGSDGRPLTRRFANAADHRVYAAALLDEGRIPVSMDEWLGAADTADEVLLMGLRREAGVSNREFVRRMGFSIEDRCGHGIGELVSLGLLEFDGEILRCTDRGMVVLDSVVLELTRAPMTLV